MIWENSSFVAAIMGAITGGLVSASALYAVEGLKYKLSRRGIFYSLFGKFNQISLGSAAIYKWLAEGKRIARQENIGAIGPTTPLLTSVPSVHLTSDELSVLYEFCDAVEAFESIECYYKYSYLVQTQSSYSDSRRDAASLIDPVKIVDEVINEISRDVFSYHYALDGQGVKLHLKSGAINKSLEDMLTSALTNMHLSRSVCDHLARIAKFHFGADLPIIVLKDIRDSDSDPTRKSPV